MRMRIDNRYGRAFHPKNVEIFMVTQKKYRLCIFSMYNIVLLLSLNQWVIYRR